MKNTTLRRYSIFLTILGLLDSIYLLWIKISQNQALCLPGLGNCWSVNTSLYSEIKGVPLSFFGAVAYLVILVLLRLEQKRMNFGQYFPVFTFGVSLAGTIYSGYLTYLELFVIKAICPFCVVSAIVMTSLLVISTLRLREIL